MRTSRTSLIAAGLTLLVIAVLGLGARCLSLTAVSCSVSTLWSEQPALDVPYVGTRSETVAKMLELANVGPQDHVVDLGTGDGRILIAAAQERGARGEGVDLDPVLIDRAISTARGEGVADRVSFRVEDLFATPLDQATVLTMFLLPEVNLKLRPRILAEMQPGARVVSHAFDMGDWRPDEAGRVGGSRVYLWVVPAQVEGRWRLSAGGASAELMLRQTFQRIGGTLTRDGVAYPIDEARLDGARIRLLLDMGGGLRLYEGVVRGDAIEGASGQWRAVRIGDG